MPSMQLARTCECLTVPFADSISEKAFTCCSMSCDVGLACLYATSFDRDLLSCSKPVKARKCLTAETVPICVLCGSMPLLPRVLLMWSKYTCMAGSVSTKRETRLYSLVVALLCFTRS